MKILHSPSDVGGQAWGLSRAEKTLGYFSENIIFESSKFSYKYDSNLHLENKPLVYKIFIQILFFIKCIFKYDVFHFYFGTSLLPKNLDLPFLKFFRKKVFFTFQGCDIRLRSEQIKIGNFTEFIIHNCSCNNIPDTKKIKKIKWIEKFANKTFALNPDLILASPNSEMLPYAHVDLNSWKPIPNNISLTYKKTLTIVHAPTDRKIKGTKFIIETVEKIKKNGYDINLLLIENLKHKDMINACKNADVIIDQLLIGWYGGFAVEMMALGKPVICYLDKRLSTFVPYFKQIPIINAKRDTLYNILINLLQNPSSLFSIGKKSRLFVEKIHNPNLIAKRLIWNYQND